MFGKWEASFRKGIRMETDGNSGGRAQFFCSLRALAILVAAQSKSKAYTNTKLPDKKPKSTAMPIPSITKKLPQDKVILGIDPGTQILGYGLIRIQGRQSQALQLGVIKLNKFKSHEIRLAKIYEKVTQLIDEYLPDEMAIESPFYGKNVQIAIKLGRAQGVSMAAAIARQIPIVEYAPKKIKQSVTGNGNASKEQVAAMVVRLLDLKAENYLLDATDALAVAITHANHGGNTPEVSGGWDKFVKENAHRLK